MPGYGLRVAMAIVGLSLLAVSVLLAGAVALVLVTLLQLDPLVLAGGLLIGALLAGVASYFFGTAHLLSTIDATELDRRRAPGAVAMLGDLVDRMDVDEPALLVAHLGEPNAFSVRGPRRSAIVVDPSLFGLLDRDEFEAVLAHELAHVESGDALVQTLAYSVVRSLVGLLVLLTVPLTILATGLAAAIAWLRGRPGGWRQTIPATVRAGVERLVVDVFLVLTLAVRAHSRHREYAADRRAARVTGRPLALARALRKIERATIASHGPLATLYVRGEDGDPLADLFSTHPDTEGRVARLRDLAERHDRRVQIDVGAP